ncbi:MAG: methyltransferase domain-containing protein [Bacteroidales bacterium]|nr:methyltransferase domain-containing protein [Bacteroidales bacterium]
MDQTDLKFFNEIAPKWDSMEVKSYPAKINEILDKVNIPEGGSVLDLGTGTGVLVPYLAERVGADGHVVAIDGSRGMLDQAVRKYGNIANVKFVEADFEEDLIEGQFDRIMLYCVYPHLKTPHDTLKWLRKVNLKPGGKIVIAFPNDENFVNHVHGDVEAHSHLLPSARVLADELALVGFTIDYAFSDPGRYVIILH